MQNSISTKLNIERELSDSEGIVQVYEVGKYTVIVRGQRKSTGDHLWVEVRKREDVPNARYLPHLSVDCFYDDGDTRNTDVLISTTSYGSLSMSEICKFMEAMEDGISTAGYIREKFLQPMADSKWNWEVSK